MRGLSFAPILAIVLGACSAPQAIDLFTIRGVVVGQVLTGSQAPIRDAIVTGTAQYPVARGSIAIDDSRATDATGVFRLVLTAGNMPDTVAPLTLHVEAPGYAPLDTAGFQVRIRRTIMTGDTTRVVLTLAR